jgi:putative membrane protein
MNASYCGPPPLPDSLLTSFNLDPVLLAALLLLGVAMRGSGAGLMATAVLAVAFVSPLCALSAALFSARVVHHVLLVAVAAPLLASALPARRPEPLGLPLAAAAVILWVSHAPPVYDAALANVLLYWLMQVSLLASAVVFWRAVLAPGRAPVEPFAAVVAAFAAMGLLGALLTFAPAPLYAAHATAPLAFGLTPLDDQRLAGLLMWVPAGTPYAVVAGLVARRGFARIAGSAA